MSTVYKKISIVLATAVLVVCNMSIVFAQNIETPKFQFAEGKLIKEIEDGFLATLNLGWNDENQNIDGFALYIYYGETKNYDDFTLYKKISIDDEDLGSQKNYYNYIIRELESKTRTISLYLTAYIGEHQSNASQIKYVNLKQNNQDKYHLRITGTPSNHAAIDDEYTFEFGIEADVEFTDLEIKLEQAPEGAELDVENMTVSWTPNAGGKYKFMLSASAKTAEGQKLHNVLPWMVDVVKCKEQAVVEGEVIAEDGTLAAFGTATLFSAESKNDPNGKYPRVYDARIVDGYYKFEGVDAGKYYLQINAYSKNQKPYYTIWYENAKNLMDATPIEIECSQSYEFDFVVEQVKEPEFFKVSGKIIDAETQEPIRWVHVKFIGLDSRNHHYNLEAISDQFGEYSVKLPAAEYLVLANALKPNSGNSIQYLPQYYKLANNIQDAVIIDVNQNISGIDFALDRVPTYENSITGKVINVDGIELSNVVVSAYCIDPGGMQEKFRFYSKSSVTDENGNFVIENLMPGKYILYASIRDKIHMPGFYVEGKEVSASWKDATEFDIEEDGSFGPYTITVPIFEKVHGSGKIKGFVKERKGSIKGGDDELQGVSGLYGINVYIFDSKMSPIKSVATDENGSFELSQIPNGKYTVVLDKVGFYPFSYEVDLTSDNNDFSNDIEMSPVSPTSVTTKFKIATTVFPNPVSDLLNIQFESAAGNVAIKLSGYNGTTYFGYDMQANEGINNISYPIQNIPQGIYFLTIEMTGIVYVTPIVISR